MRSCFFFTLFYFLFGNHLVYCQSTPAVELSEKTAVQILGATGLTRAKRTLNCTTLLNKDWAYPNAQVTGFCYDAETACLRYGLIIQAIKNGKGEAELTRLKQDFALAVNDVALRLRGCQLAIEASVSSPDFLRQMTDLFSKKQKNY